jgi:hypothetical protein
VQPPCQQEMAVFIGFYDRAADEAEKLAGSMDAHPAI